MVPFTRRAAGPWRELAAALLLASSATAAAAQADVPDLAKLGRPADEVGRDATSKPLELYHFYGIRQGTVVADLFAGGGYNTAILSHLVGDGGVVWSQDGRQGAVAQRLSKGDLKGRTNVVVFRKLADLPADTLDVALTVRNYHDVPAEEIPDFLAEIRRVLKPDGVFAVVDVRSRPGTQERTPDLHRIPEELVVEEVTAAGFRLEGRSDMLARSGDDYASAEFDNREATDRMVLKFRKPREGAADSTG